MWNPFNQDSDKPGFRIWRIIRISVFVLIGLVIFWTAITQSLNIVMNFVEFNHVFTKTLLHSIVSGLILCSIAVVRVDFRHRNSMTWFGINLLIKLLKRGEPDSSSSYSASSSSSSSFGSSSSASYSTLPSRLANLPLRYPDFKMSKRNFVMWQITKLVLFAPLFTQLVFGISSVYLLQGHDIGIGALPGIFLIPFSNIPSNGSFAQEHVVPLIPAMTLLIPPILSSIGIRVFLYIGVAGGISIGSRYMADTSQSKPKLLSYISTMEMILGATLLWTGFTMFFNFNINYNTKYAILGTWVMGAFFIAYSYIDGRRSRVIITPERKQIYTRLLTILVITIITGSIMAVNNSIADAKQLEWSGPYVAQDIAINRYIAGIDHVKVTNFTPSPPPTLASFLPSLLHQQAQQQKQLQSFNFSMSNLPPGITALVKANNNTLNNIRLWDQQAAQIRLKPQLGQKNDVNFADADVIAPNNSMYWAVPTAPNLPADVTPEDTWYNQHFVYTHSDKGVLMLDANTGKPIDSSKFFKQKNIYYGESGPTGIFNQAWSAFPVSRTSSDEIDGTFYKGTGGINVSPPLSWVFEPKFMLSFPDSTMHIMRFKDIFDRMKTMFPYFVYEFTLGPPQTALDVRTVDVIPVTDGTNTYWLMPLIVFLDTSHVPWSSGDMLRLVGFALIDAYNGSVKIIKNPAGDANDPFSKVFFEQYTGNLGEATVLSHIPDWLNKQLIYPEELFLWQINRFNQYHVTDPQTFIQAQQFYRTPDEPSANYYLANPPGSVQPQFLGIQSLQLSNSPSDNLVGYMAVQNSPATFGNMTFYSIPLDSTTKVISQGAARDALEKDPGYINEKASLRNPRLGDELLYRIGNQQVYFIPVYTSGTTEGGNIQLGTIGVVSASIKDNSYVGLGSTPQQAFENYMLKAIGLVPENQSSSVTGASTNATSNSNSTAANKQQQQQLPSQTKQIKPNPADIISSLEKFITSSGLTILKPTAISAPLSFKDADLTYQPGKTALANLESGITKFLTEVKSSAASGNSTAPAPASPSRIFEWQTNDAKVVNFGVFKVVDGIAENHYISIHLG